MKQQNNGLLSYFTPRGRGVKSESPSVRNGNDNETILCFLLICANGGMR